ncbi:MAG: DNA polymerase I [Candidatus Parcubacteria bacterium]|jgi:DNA polymerase-1|nr:MAG: DNA polymerase I [Candidatus Parcubacteria bacterium]
MSKNQKPKLLIIDGHALIHRSFHALPTSLATKDGTVVNAVYGFTSFLLKACLEFKPKYVVLTLDSAGPTFRHEEYTDYKATRAAAPDEFYHQVPLVEEVAKALDIPIFIKPGFEADDLIGTIASRAAKETDWISYIVTGDMDSLQLVTERTFVYAMSRGLSESVTYDKEAVEARYGLRPDQIVDYKALRGDPSDNIPGVKGIGEKTATELLQTFGNLKGVYGAVKKNDQRLKPRVAELLISGQEEAWLSQGLATIKCDVDLEIDWESWQLELFDLNKATELFTALEFRSLLGRLRQLKDLVSGKNNNDAPETTELKPQPKEKINYQLLKTETDFKKFLKKLAAQKEFAFNVEAQDNKLLGLAFCWSKTEAYYLDLETGAPQDLDLFNYQKNGTATPAYLEKLRPFLENAAVKKITHDSKRRWRLLNAAGLNLKGISFDTFLADYLLTPDNRHHDLETLAFRELGWEKKTVAELLGKGTNKISFGQVDAVKKSEFAGEEAALIWRLAKSLTPKIKAENLTEVLENIELPLAIILGKMENAGIKVETEPLEKLTTTLEKRLKEIRSEAVALVDEDFNINSPKQLQTILFEKLKLETKGIKKTKSGYSTADLELQKIADAHPIVPLLQEYRELNKLLNTYSAALPKMISPKTGRIHTNYQQAVAATGRLSSSEPNLQNIPAHKEAGQEIRRAFVASPGCKLLSLDYSQIELRLAAHFSGDKKLLAAFKNNQDIHRATAAQINEVPLEEVTKQMRFEAKAINFGILYGQGPHGLSQNAHTSYQKARDFIAKYFAVYPKVKEMVDRFIAEAQDRGYTETLGGRKRYLPDLNSSNPIARRAAERMATNTPIQGSAADLIKIAMINIDQKISGQEEEIRLLLQIHDELIFEIKTDRVDYWLPKLKDLMESALSLSVPIVVESSTGDSWADLK